MPFILLRMFSRTALALALLAGSVSADLSAYPGQTLYASDSSGHCYKYITGTSLDQDADNIAGCSAAGFVSENSLGSMSVRFWPVPRCSPGLCGYISMLEKKSILVENCRLTLKSPASFCLSCSHRVLRQKLFPMAMAPATTAAVAALPPLLTTSTTR